MTDVSLVPTDARSGRPHSTWDGSGWKWAVEKLALPAALCLTPLIYQTLAQRNAEAARQAEQIQAQKLSEQKARRDLDEQKFQLYTTFLTKREEADSSLRHGLFDKLLGTYFKPNASDPYQRLVELELLAVNFHDALNLNPLFWDMRRAIEQMPSSARRNDFRNQLDRVAEGVKDRQAAMLEIGGTRESLDVYLEFVGGGKGSFEKSFDGQVPMTGGFLAKRRFTLQVLEKDDKNRRLYVQILSDAGSPPFPSISFWVDTFDFPLTNFSRISAEERVAVTLSKYNEPEKGVAEVTFLYFPSTRSAVKDKPYIDDLILKLLPQQAKDAAAPAVGIGNSSMSQN